MGREDELAVARSLLEHNRLVTLTGPGGSGKTRLGIELASRTLDGFAEGNFKAEHPKLMALYEAFDAKADAIAVTAADRSTADAFEAYRRESNAADARMAAAAKTGKQARFDAAYYAVHRMFDTTSTLKDLAAAGIICNAR